MRKKRADQRDEPCLVDVLDVGRRRGSGVAPCLGIGERGRESVDEERAAGVVGERNGRVVVEHEGEDAVDEAHLPASLAGLDHAHDRPGVATVRQ